MSKFYNPQHQGWEMSKIAAITRSRVQPNPYPVGSSAWEEYERGAQFYRELRAWDGRGSPSDYGGEYKQ